MIERFIVSWDIWGTESIGVKEFQFMLDGYELVDASHWSVSFYVVAHTLCAHASSKVKIFCSLSGHLGVHMFRSMDQVAVLQF